MTVHSNSEEVTGQSTRSKLLKRKLRQRVLASEWTEEEFQALLNGYGLTDKELAEKLRQRRIGAIEVVRAGIHSFHKGGNISMLSRMMTGHLEERRGSIICPVCRVRF
jgi:hypothetical protein